MSIDFFAAEAAKANERHRDMESGDVAPIETVAEPKPEKKVEEKAPEAPQAHLNGAPQRRIGAKKPKENTAKGYIRKSPAIMITMPEDMKHELKQVAYKNDTSVSALLRLGWESIRKKYVDKY